MEEVQTHNRKGQRFGTASSRRPLVFFTIHLPHCVFPFAVGYVRVASTKCFCASVNVVSG